MSTVEDALNSVCLCVPLYISVDHRHTKIWMMVLLHYIQLALYSHNQFFIRYVFLSFLSMVYNKTMYKVYNKETKSSVTEWELL